MNFLTNHLFMQDFVANLKWRGMMYDVTPGTAAQLKEEQTAGYIGFEPTAPSLHIGNLAVIMLLKHFQHAGHKPILVIGGATGMIGDPSWKKTERKLLSEAEIRHNQDCIRKQLGHFFDCTDQENAVEILNNLDWFKELGLLTFLRAVGKHFSLNYMMAKDTVKRRVATGISFTEFTYQLLQGYDFYHLYTTRNVKLQMGGADQWGNLTAGTELIRRKAGGKAFALTMPLLTKADGSKFGKTEQGKNIWLDPMLTSPYEFYQFWLNCADGDAKDWIKIFTLLNQEAINTLIQAHNATPHQRILQKALAKELTIMVHSKNAYIKAAKTAEILFGNTTPADLQLLDEKDFLTIFSNVPKITIHRTQLEGLADIVELVSSATQGVIFQSKSEARRIIQGGGLSINKVKITDLHQKPSLLQGQYLLVQKGKKHYYLIVLL